MPKSEILKKKRRKGVYLLENEVNSINFAHKICIKGEHQMRGFGELVTIFWTAKREDEVSGLKRKIGAFYNITDFFFTI